MYINFKQSYYICRRCGHRVKPKPFLPNWWICETCDSLTQYVKQEIKPKLYA